MYATSANEKSMRLWTLLNDLSDIELWMKLQWNIDCMLYKMFYIQSSFIVTCSQLVKFKFLCIMFRFDIGSGSIFKLKPITFIFIPQVNSYVYIKNYTSYTRRCLCKTLKHVSGVIVAQPGPANMFLFSIPPDTGVSQVTFWYGGGYICNMLSCCRYFLLDQYFRNLIIE